MLDKQSEKVLKYIIDNTHYEANSEPQLIEGKDISNALNIPMHFLSEICENLGKDNYIKCLSNDFSEVIAIYLKQKGLFYFENRKTENRLFYKQIALSKVSDFIVSFITAALTASNWDNLVSFFTSLFDK